jgi:hypothetical protein
VGEAEAQVRARRVGIVQRHVRFGEAQVVHGVIGVGRCDFLEQLQADLRVTVLEQRRRRDHVKGAEELGGGAVAEVGIELATAPRVALDVAEQVRREQPLRLDEAPGDRGPG